MTPGPDGPKVVAAGGPAIEVATALKTRAGPKEIVMANDPPPIGADIEAWREWVRRMPGAVVHHPQQQVPFEPDVHVINVTDIDELIGQDDGAGENGTDS